MPKKTLVLPIDFTKVEYNKLKLRNKIVTKLEAVETKFQLTFNDGSMIFTSELESDEITMLEDFIDFLVEKNKIETK